MFGLFQSTTPQYAGDGQPSTSSTSGGLFGFLTGLLGTSTPIYQARSETTKSVVPAASPKEEVAGSSSEIAQAIEPDCLAPLPVAIVIQRRE